jgi:tryptophanyl-tRNA synthetase
MSKSLDNAIYLSDDAKTVQKKVRRMVTDISGTHPRLKATDPGVVEYNPVFLYHDVFNPDTEEVADLKERYEKGTVSDGEVKDKLVAALNAFLDPIRERRARILDRAGYAAEVLEDGSRREREVAQETIAEVREAMRLVYT